MNKYERTTIKKKDSIIASALLLFENKGFTEASIKEIAEKAKVSQVSIYNYFGSKEALVAECAKIVMEDTIKKAKEILSWDLSFSEKLMKAMYSCTESANMSISKRFSEAALADSTLLNLLENSINRIKIEIYREYIELGKKEKAINKNLSTEVILAFLEALNSIGSISEEMYLTEIEIEQIHHLLLYGIIGVST